MFEAPFRRGMTLVMLALFTLPMLGCGDDGLTEPSEDPVDPAGTWILNVTVTDATGDCDGEEGISTPETITITITGGTEQPFNVSVSGFLGNPANVLTGTFDNNRLLISGSYAEDGGTTTATHDLVATSDNRMVGDEAWGWTDGILSCPGSTSTVRLTRA